MFLSHGLRRIPSVIAMAFVLAAAAGGCGSSTPTPAAPQDTSCDRWCGNGRATITFEGGTAAISTGGCYDQGAAGIDARFGDWLGVKGLSSYLMMTFTPRASAASAASSAGPAGSAGASAGATASVGPASSAPAATGPAATGSAGAGASSAARTPAAVTPAPQESADQAASSGPTIDGSVGGAPFVLGPDAVVTYNSDGTGSFSGADVNTGEMATGDFACH